MLDRDAPTNIPASVLQRLYNLAQAQGLDYNLLLTRYAIERLLYRVSISPHAKAFVLKGAQLFMVWSGARFRPTTDIDLHCTGDSAVSAVESMFRTVAVVASDPFDGILFQPDTVHGEDIREEARYAGVRVHVGYQIARARGKVQVDVGFGDAVTPRPTPLAFPVLLDFPQPTLLTYPRETMVAEKLEAMVVLGMRNSRMKDFYDLLTLARLFHFDGDLLRRAIRATFDRRQTPLPVELPIAMTPEFAQDRLKQTQWAAFMRKGIDDEAILLEQVITVLQRFLWPPLHAAALNQPYLPVWVPGEGWSDNVL